MDYEWDESKKAANRAKHGVDFERMELFDWNTAHVEIDERHEESRFNAFGFIGDRLYACCHTWRADVCRVIGLRKANLREKKKYERNS